MLDEAAPPQPMPALVTEGDGRGGGGRERVKNLHTYVDKESSVLSRDNLVWAKPNNFLLFLHHKTYMHP